MIPTTSGKDQVVTLGVRNVIILVHALIFGLTCALRPICDWIGLETNSSIFAVSILFVGLSVWSFGTWRLLSGSWFDPYSWFLLAAFLFNGGQVFLEVLDLNQDGIMEGALPPDRVLDTVIFVAMSLAAMHLGALLSTMGSFFRNTKAAPVIDPQYMRWVGWGLLAISLPFACIYLKDILSVVLSSGYFALYQRESATGIDAGAQVLASFLLPAALFLLAASQVRRSGQVVSALLVLAYACMQLFLGFRSLAVMPLIAYAWVWHRAIAPLPKTFLLSVGLTLTFIAFPLIQATRLVSGSDRSSLDFLVEAFFSIDNPIVASISEMGTTMATVGHTLAAVPATRNYEYGMSYLYAFSTIIPNLFWDIHPAITQESSPGAWLTAMVDPISAEAGGSIGSSFIAEAFANFGWFGGPLTLLGFGWLCGRFALWGQHSCIPIRLATVGSGAALLAKFVRSDALEIVRPLIWNSLIPCALVFLLQRLGNSRVGETPTIAPSQTDAASQLPRAPSQDRTILTNHTTP